MAHKKTFFDGRDDHQGASCLNSQHTGITNIRLHNFKCFEELDLSCSALNLLCGMNGSGKSTAIQSLLVLRQSLPSVISDHSRLRFSGTLVRLGSATDVLREGATDNEIRISLRYSSIDEEWESKLGVDDNDNLSLGHTNIMSEDDDDSAVDASLDNVEGWVEMPLFKGPFAYVEAERVGPRTYYPAISEEHGATSSVDRRGVRSWDVLWRNRRKPLPEEDPRNTTNTRDVLLLPLLQHWMDTISPGVRLTAELVSDADMIVPGFSFRRSGDIPSRSYRPTNVGFGLSYTLHVILALLSEPGSLCIIENPEAHLHPRGQTKMGELAALASKAGVQVFVETHSDHFMDGVRIAVREGIIEPEKVTFSYFEREGNTASVVCPKIDDDGRLSEWPKGFFDQADENLDRLLAPKDLR